MVEHKIKVNTNKCIGCKLCVDVCVANNIRIDKENNKAELLSEKCIKCGQCAAICPKEAISISGYDTPMISMKANKGFNPDDVLDTIRFRRTIRSFQDKKIPQNVVGQILEAGRLTHTAKNSQDVSFIVINKEKEAVEKIAVSMFRKLKKIANLFSEMARNNVIDDHFFFFNAPIVIVILAKNKTNGLLAAQNMEFVAEAHGLGVLFSGFFTMCANHSIKLRKKLQIPKGKKVAMTLVLGYPKVKFMRSAQRKDLDVKYM